MLIGWDELPEEIKTNSVRPYWEALEKRKTQIAIKRFFDVLMSWILLVIFAIPMIVISVIIKLDSPGPVFFRQERVTVGGMIFRIHKFRTMTDGAEKKGSSVTVSGDNRITRSGKVLRKLRLDEMPQLLDVLAGNMSFVGTRPEVPKYVEKYEPEYYATLLLPAGITSEASIRYKDEQQLLSDTDDVDRVYMEKIVPEKMKWNLESIRNYSITAEIKTLIRTVAAVLGKDYT